MKKQFLKHVLISSVLVSIFTLSLKVAHATQEVKYVVQTVCCNGSTYTGNSNDCVSGSGGCVDGHCAAGETETAAMSCPG